MSKFTEGMKVVIIENNELREGIIKTLYPNENVAIVDFGNNEIGKVSICSLGIPMNTEQEEKEEPKKPELKTEITITREEFQDIASGAVAKVAIKRGPMTMMLGAVILARLEMALFSDVVENE